LRQPVVLASVLKPFGIRSASSASGAFAGRARYSRLRRIGTLAPPVSRWLQAQPQFSQSDHFMVCFTAQVIEPAVVSNEIAPKAFGDGRRH
jgi:hypothetical protein